MEISKLYNIYLENPSVKTDSRKVGVGDIFFALKGPSFNGNKFANEALKKGAAFSIIDETEYIEDGNDKIILVDDCLVALQQLASYHSSKLNIPIVGITGSNGKTTSKELLDKVLSSQYSCYATEGNLNNHIGVPLSVLGIKPQHEIAIIEMGANHVGEIDLLSKICQPTHGLITNVGKAHLEGFGSFEGVKKAKSELYKYLEDNKGIAFINSNEPELLKIEQDFKMLKIYYGTERSSIPNFKFNILKEDPFLKINFSVSEKEHQISSHLSGIHNFQNILSAAFLGFYFKVPLDKIVQAISNYLPENNRSQIIDKGSNQFYLDAYNANPSSMRASISAFLNLAKNKRKIAILGDMFELGDFAAKEHKDLIVYVLAQEFDLVVFVGEHFNKAKEETGKYFMNVTELKQWFDKQYFKETFFLVKGSRGISLEKLIN